MDRRSLPDSSQALQHCSFLQKRFDRVAASLPAQVTAEANGSVNAAAGSVLLQCALLMKLTD